MRSVSLMTATSKYEGYREAWHLLHEAVGSSPNEPTETEESVRAEEPAPAEKSASQFSPFSAFGRMEAAMKQIRQRLEGGKLPPSKPRDDV